ncbi:hypothetical protein PPERSA_05274 [Pseudocohnilembus persalinus]|uniref:Transmembrane protein n=1 Tax=Pseudocohnilembus persalinus TaxID=266149 RepID=A0A0V0R6B1_PSEPJ|nr:hypothetical protein PPERSA_05274 [Pseudocohnilembus persalinus]|eukprot:KRX09882.1 hypothetical protein PPERSA_05274 [Pseudocohnilembus persalinus]
MNSEYLDKQRLQIFRQTFLNPSGQPYENVDEGVISYKQYQDSLNNLNPMYDQEVYEQIYQQMEQSNSTNIQGFSFYWGKAEEILQQRSLELRRQLEQLNNQKRQNLQSLQQAQQSEELNLPYNVMKGSKLIIKLLEINRVDVVKGLQKGFAVMNVGQNRYQTKLWTKQQHKYVDGDVFVDGYKGIWNEIERVFPIETGQEQLSLLVLDQNNLNKNSKWYNGETSQELVGRVNIPVHKFADQKKVTEEFKLYVTDSFQSDLSIVLQAQWIHSYVKMYADRNRELIQQIAECEDDLLHNENSLSQLYKPFPQLLELYQQSQINKGLLQPEQQSSVQQSRKRNQANSNVMMFKQSKQVNAVFFEVDNKYFQILKYLFYALIFLSAWNMLYRQNQVDICIGFLFLVFYELHILDANNCLFLAIFTLIGIIVDITWLSKYSGEQWNGDNYQILLQYEKVSVILTYIQLLMKLPILGLLIMMFQNLRPYSMPVSFVPQGANIFPVQQQQYCDALAVGDKSAFVVVNKDLYASHNPLIQGQGSQFNGQSSYIGQTQNQGQQFQNNAQNYSNILGQNNISRMQ